MRYLQGWKALSRLLHEDRSFSGQERNCAFLNTPGNTGNQRFTDVSAASGLDFDDDGRAVALADWDFDGDLDIWVTNRTAPRIRLLRNNSPRENHFLAITLQGDGQGTNRDAIGARVEVVLAEDDSRPLIKTLSAGDGFLSQSSRWLHFGLGKATKIQHVVVRWPGGEVRQYDNVQVDERYVIDQQTGNAQKWTSPPDRKPLVASQQAPLESSGVTRTVLPAPRLLPTLKTVGKDEPLSTRISRPTIISIWSANCTSCLQELQEYAQHAEQIRAAGLDVVAVNLDNLEDSTSNAENILRNIDFPFSAEFGSVDLVRSLDMFKRAVFDRWDTLNVPTSLLVNPQGYVYVLYQGRISVDQLLADMKLLQVPSEQLRRFSTPFSGRWIMPPPQVDPLQVTTRFIDEAMVAQGIDYLERHAQILEGSTAKAGDQEPGDLYYVLAILLRDQAQIDESVEAFRKAIEYRPNDFRFRNDFASLLARIGRLDESAEQLQQGHRINPQEISVQRKLAFIRMKQRNFSAAIERFKNVVAANPNDVACWYNLANAYRTNGQLDQAMKSYRQTLKIQPQMVLAANNLAWILATHPDSSVRNGAESVNWATKVCEQTRFSHPGFLDTLACAYAELGDFDKAEETANRAIQIFTKSGKTESAKNIQSRLELFRQQQPFRDQRP